MLYWQPCEIRGDESIINYSDKILPASESDWSTEYLDSILSIKQVGPPDTNDDPLTSRELEEVYVHKF